MQLIIVPVQYRCGSCGAHLVAQVPNREATYVLRCIEINHIQICEQQAAPPPPPRPTFDDVIGEIVFRVLQRVKSKSGSK